MGLILTFKQRAAQRQLPGKRYIMRCVGELFLHCCHNDDKREPAAAPNIHIANITFAVSDKSWCTIALLQFFVRGTKATTEKKQTNKQTLKKTNKHAKQTKPNLKHVKTPAVLAWHSPASASPTFGT